MRSLFTFVNDETGASAIEYAVILALIVVVLISGVQSISEVWTGPPIPAAPRR